MVEIKETQEVVIAKPVAIRPSLSNLKSLSELVSGGGASPTAPPKPAESAVTIIRPRTVRFKPVSSFHLAAGDEAHQPPSGKVPEADIVRNVVYKPVARLVSKRTESLLTNLGSGCGNMLTKEIAEFGTSVRSSDEDNHRTDLPSNLHQSFPTQSGQKAHSMQGNSADEKMSILPQIRHRASYDGHSWRKYGQKQVKGSEYPRSYYKCTHPNCPMKKKVEKTLDGRIAEIVYSGEHNHPKPQPFSSMLSDPNVQNPTMQDEERNLAQVSQQDDRIEGCEQRSEDPRTIGFCVHLPVTSATMLVNDPGAAAAGNASVSTSNDSLGQSGECEEASKYLEVKGDDFRRKRMMPESPVIEANVDCDVIGDGFRWRKYGQKVVKGNPYPRSYYKCTSRKCQARKYVERTSEDPSSFITTYEGRHNHDQTIKSTDSETSKKSSKKRS